MARHSLACSCPSVCPRCKFQTVLHVEYIPDEIHALGLPSSKRHTWDEYDLFIFGEGFLFPVWRNMHNTIQDFYFHMQGILVIAESP